MSDGPIHYPHKFNTYRFMFSDGKTVDVVSIHASSTIRGWVLDQMKNRMDVMDKDLRIEGVAVVTPPTPQEEESP